MSRLIFASTDIMLLIQIPHDCLTIRLFQSAEYQLLVDSMVVETRHARAHDLGSSFATSRTPEKMV